MKKTTTAGALLAAGALACAVPAAAQAAAAETTLVLTAGCIPAGQEKALVTYAWTFVDGESPVGPILDGRYPSDVADTYVGPGVHTYTYTVIDLATLEETVKGPFTFTVEACETVPTATDVTPQAPTLTGDAVAIPVVEGVVYRDKATGAELAGSIVLPAGSALEVVAAPRDERYRIPAGVTVEWRFVVEATAGPGDGGGGTGGAGESGGDSGASAGSGDEGAAPSQGNGDDHLGGANGFDGSHGSDAGNGSPASHGTGAPGSAPAGSGDRLAVTGAADLAVTGGAGLLLAAGGALLCWARSRTSRA